ncbi:MAG: hypothetical protein IT290_10970 [Deltaproteobacteria bacterium]|nr:hypothetical protein [Deltaproteobacteria bacterium]
MSLTKAFNKRTGELEVEIEVENATGASCSFVLEMSRYSDMRSPTRKSLYRGTSGSVSGVATSLPKKVYGTRTTSADVYMRGSYECAGSAAVVSSTARIRHTKSSDRDYGSVRAWISKVASKIRRSS